MYKFEGRKVQQVQEWKEYKIEKTKRRAFL